MSSKHVLRGILCETQDRSESDILSVVGDTGGVTWVSQWAEGLRLPRDRQCTVRYFVTDQRLSAEELQEAWVRKFTGDPCARYDIGSCYDSGWTPGDERFDVGRHDLIQQLRGHLGKFLHLEVEAHDVK